MSRSTGAQLAFGIAGAAIGLPFGQGALGFALGASLGGSLFQDSLPDQNGPRLDDLTVGSSSYGLPISIIYGTHRISTNMIWVDPGGIRETSHKEEVGGKGAPSQDVTTYSYSLTAAYGICEGEISAIRRIWVNNQLVYNVGDTATGGDLYVSAELAKNVYVHYGTSLQEPSSLQESFEGVGNVPAYRGLAYIEFEDLQLARFNSTTINVEVEVVKATTPDTPPNLIATLDSSYGYTAGLADNGVFHTTKYTSNTPSIKNVLMHDYVYDYEGNLIQDDSWLIETESTSRTTVFSACPNDPRFMFSMMLGFPPNGSIYNHKGYGRIGAVLCPDGSGARFNYNSSSPYVLTCCRIGNYMIMTPEDLVNNKYIARYQIDPITGIMELTPDIGYLQSTFGMTSGKSISSMSIDDDGEHCWMVTTEATLAFIRVNANLEIVNKWTAVELGDLPYYSRNNILMRKKEDGYTYGLTIAGSAPGAQYLRYGYFDADTSGSPYTYLYNVDIDPNINLYFNTNSIGNGFAHIDGRIYSIDDLISQNTETLEDIVVDVCDRCGINSGNVDATALSGINVKGYAIGHEMNGRSVIEPLQKTYYFDMPLIGSDLVSVLRGGSSVRSIVSDDMSAHVFGQPADDVIKITRKGEKELPKRVVVKYIEQGADYQVNEQHADRITSLSDNILTINIPVVLSADEAAQIADIAISAIYAERENVIYSLGPENIELTPADIVTVTDNAIRTRIVEMTVEPFGPISINGVVDYAAAYTSSASGISHTAGGTTIAYPGPTQLELLNIPLLRRTDDGGGIYAAASGYFDGWGGVNVYKSYDSGLSFSTISTITTGSIIGRATTQLADAPDDGRTWDYSGSVTIRTVNGQSLTSDSEINVLNGANIASLGVNGSYELIQWVTATDNLDGTYTLTNLLRGRLGTEHNAGVHAVGDLFVKLTTAATRFLSIEDSERNASRMYKGVSIGNLIQNTDAFSFTYTGESLKPLSPCNIDGSRDGSNNLTITWDRRSRYNYTSLFALPLGEDSEEYQVDIYDNSGTPVFLRTVSPNPTSETASYTAAEQTADGATPGDPFNVKIYQVSATVGNGHAGEALI